MPLARRLVFVPALAAALAGSASADVITQWNFNAITPGNIATATPSTGAGAISLVGGTTTPTSGSSGTGSSDPNLPNLAFQTTTYPAQGAASGTAGVQFLVSTVGFGSIGISFDTRHSNTSSAFLQVQYTIDGVNFVDLAGGVFQANLGDTWFNNRSVDLSGIAGVANNANFGFRIVSIFAPGTSAYAASNPASTYAGGTLRYDMVTVTGVIPAPGAVALLGLAGLAGTRRRRD